MEMTVMLADQLVVVGVGPDPEPEVTILDFKGQCARNLFESQRRVAWIALEKLTIRVS
jgi:hypothetical protein